MNRKKFDSLSPKLQKLIMDKQLEVEKEMPAIVADLKAKERDKLEKSGMIFVALSPDEAKKWKRMANDTRFAALASRINPDNMTKIKSMIVR